jgi:hypothetical protein
MDAVKNSAEKFRAAMRPVPRLLRDTTKRVVAEEIRKARAVAKAVAEAIPRRTNPTTATVKSGEELPGAHALARMRGLLGEM